MPKLYAFKCTSCGRKEESHLNIPSPCPCGGICRRDYSSVSFSRSFQPHFNHSVGRFVRNKTEFRDALKEHSESASLRTGIDHNFVPIDHGDAPGVTSEGLDETAKRRRDTGETQPTKRIFT